MIMHRIYLILGFTSSLFLVACGSSESHDHGSDDHGHEKEHAEEVHLSRTQFEALGLKVDTIPSRNMAGSVEATGQLEVPPQNEATVTAMIGANVQDIMVIEGDPVREGQPLAYLTHPDLIQLQTDYLENTQRLEYVEQEYNRQKKLYEEEVGSGKTFQQTKSEYGSLKATVNGLKHQLSMLGIDVSKMQEGELYDRIPVRSPIDGFIKKVAIKLGQFVEPQTELFEVINNHHIHADLMVFEKDVHKVKEGQKVMFTVQSLPGEELAAEIYAVGKSFEQDPKAVHIHAEIENKRGLLLPGMYVKGRILLDEQNTLALPEEAIVREDDKYFVFMVTEAPSDPSGEWHFEPMEVYPGTQDNGWIAIRLLYPNATKRQFAWNSAYYLLAEMKKGEGGHGHAH